MSDEDLIAFETEKGMSFEAWLENENETIADNTSSVRLSDGKLIGERKVVNGVTVTDFVYYVTVTESGSVLLYNTEKGRNDADENDLATDIKISFTADGKNAIIYQPISEGSESMRLRIYEFDKEIEDYVPQGILGKIFVLKGYSYRFTSDAERIAFETSEGKTVEQLIEEANATVTAESYKMITIDKNGTIVCESISGNGATVSEFTYYVKEWANGEISIYYTAEGRDGADYSDTVKGIGITATADGVEIAYALNDSAQNARIEIFEFDKISDADSIADVDGKIFVTEDFRYVFGSDADMTAFETAHGKTISEIIAQKKSELTASYTRLTFEKDGRVVCERITRSVVSVIQFQYYADIAEDGTVTLYNTAAGRDSKNQNDIASTDVVLRVTSTGVELTQPISNGSKSLCIESFEFSSELPVFGACPDISGQRYNSGSAYAYFASESELSAFETAQGMTVEKFISANGIGGRIYIDNNGRIFSLTYTNDLNFIYYMDIESDGTVTLYNTASGRNSKLASDIAKTDMKITVTSDGKSLILTKPLVTGSKNTYVKTFNLSGSFTESNVPTVANKVYATTDYSVYWIFDAKENLAYFENSLLNYEYYASVYNGGEMLLFVDDDSRFYGDPNGLASNIEEVTVLINGDFICVKLTNGKVIWLNQITNYSNLSKPTIVFQEDYDFHYVLSNNMKIDDPLDYASVRNNSSAKLQVIWYRDYGDYRERISGTPNKAGNYVFKIVCAPFDSYQAVYLEKQISIVTIDSYIRNAVKLELSKTTEYTLNSGVTYYVEFTPTADSQLYMYPAVYTDRVVDMFVYTGGNLYEARIYNSYYVGYYPHVSGNVEHVYSAGVTYRVVFTVAKYTISHSIYLTGYNSKSLTMTAIRKEEYDHTA